MKRGLLVTIAGLFFLTLGAQASVPPSQFLIKSWLNRHQGMRSLKVKTKVTLIENGKSGTSHFTDVTFFQANSQLLKSTAYDDQNKEFYSVDKNLNTASIAAKLLFGTDLKTTIESCREIGLRIPTEEELVPIKTEEERRKLENESFNRFNKIVAWVIGSAEGSDSLIPQLWLVKDAFLPLRLVYNSKTEEGIQDVRFENFHFHHEFPYPRMVTVFDKDGKNGLQSELIEMNVNVAVPSMKGQENSVSGDMKKLLTQFYGIVR